MRDFTCILHPHDEGSKMLVGKWHLIVSLIKIWLISAYQICVYYIHAIRMQSRTWLHTLKQNFMFHNSLDVSLITDILEKRICALIFTLKGHFVIYRLVVSHFFSQRSSYFYTSRGLWLYNVYMYAQHNHCRFACIAKQSFHWGKNLTLTLQKHNMEHSV